MSILYHGKYTGWRERERLCQIFFRERERAEDGRRKQERWERRRGELKSATSRAITTFFQLLSPIHGERERGWERELHYPLLGIPPRSNPKFLSRISFPSICQSSCEQLWLCGFSAFQSSSELSSSLVPMELVAVGRLSPTWGFLINTSTSLGGSTGLGADEA